MGNRDIQTSPRRTSRLRPEDLEVYELIGDVLSVGMVGHNYGNHM